jgi:hypothetical protein
MAGARHLVMFIGVLINNSGYIMFMQLLGLVDIAVAIILLLRFSNPIALFFVLLLLIKGVASVGIPILPATNYIVHFCAIVDILAAIMLLISFGFGGLAFFAVAYYAIKGLWSLAFGVIFN